MLPQLAVRVGQTRDVRVAAGIHLHGFLESPGGVAVQSQVIEGRAKIGFRIAIRCKRKGFSVGRDRFTPFALLEVCATQIVVSRRPIGRQLRNPAKRVYSLFALSKVGACRSQIVEVEPVKRIDFSGLLIGGNGVLAARRQVDMPQATVAFVRARRQLQS